MKSRLLQGCKSTLFSFLPKARTNIQCNAIRLKSSIAIDSAVTRILSASPRVAIKVSSHKRNIEVASPFSEDYLATGLNHFKNSDYFKAEACFDNIIASAYEKEFINLTTNQKNILACALTSKAKIVAVGTDEDMDAAMDFLDLALELSPRLKEAEQLLNSLRSERPESMRQKKF